MGRVLRAPRHLSPLAARLSTRATATPHAAWGVPGADLPGSGRSGCLLVISGSASSSSWHTRPCDIVGRFRDRVHFEGFLKSQLALSSWVLVSLCIKTSSDPLPGFAGRDSPPGSWSPSVRGAVLLGAERDAGRDCT